MWSLCVPFSSSSVAKLARTPPHGAGRGGNGGGSAAIGDKGQPQAHDNAMTSDKKWP